MGQPPLFEPPYAASKQEPSVSSICAQKWQLISNAVSVELGRAGPSKSLVWA